MKKCPFCAEEIQEEAVLCRFCGQFLLKKPRRPWYFQTGWLITAVVCVGPLAIPLLWRNPNYSRRNKIVWTIAILLITWGSCVLMQRSIKSIEDFYGILDQLN